MGIIKKLLGGSEDKAEFKKKLHDAQEDDRIARIVEERKMSSNERDLLKRMNQKREDEIKVKLDTIRKKENSEMWKSKNLILGQKATILKNDRPILKEKNIFVDHRNDIPFTQKGDMFFKW
jgi:hypothetical protein